MGWNCDMLDSGFTGCEFSPYWDHCQQPWASWLPHVYHLDPGLNGYPAKDGIYSVAPGIITGVATGVYTAQEGS